MAFRENNGEMEVFDGMFASMPANETLRQLDAMIDWRKLRRLLGKAYDDSGVGYPGYDPVILAKMLLLESIYRLSDVQVSAEAADRLSFREFLGLGAGARVPDDTTLVRFRDRLRRHKLMDRVEKFFRGELARRGLDIRTGAITVIDASLIPAATNPPRSEGTEIDETVSKGTESVEKKKNDDVPEKRDREAGFAKRKKTTVFGYKLHIAQDRETGIVTSYDVTPANVHDSNVFESLLTGTESWVLADKAYGSAERRENLRNQNIGDGIMYRGKRGAPLEDWQHTINKMLGRIRGAVETTFGNLKRWRGCGRARFIGLERVREQMTWGILAHNLLIATKSLETCAQ